MVVFSHSLSTLYNKIDDTKGRNKRSSRWLGNLRLWWRRNSEAYS